MLRLGSHLAEKKAAPAPVFFGRDVAGATWTISWFISENMRSLAGKVSKACDSGATSKTSRLCGADS